MSDKASAAGWVIEVRRHTSGPQHDVAENTYYNVAGGDPEKATEAAVTVAKKAGFLGVGHHVRPLSADEIEVLRLKPGQVNAA